MSIGFNPAEAEDGFRRISCCNLKVCNRGVSIQPKPKTGLEDTDKPRYKLVLDCFNPAEAEDGFRRNQAKACRVATTCFNPAEAEDGFRSMAGKFQIRLLVGFQSSRSRRRVQKLYNMMLVSLIQIVSIQPKPKTGLEVSFQKLLV